MNIRVRASFGATIRGITRLQKKQIPFVTAQSLTKVAKLGQAGVRRVTESKFDIRAKSFIMRNIRITPAKKIDAKRGKAFSAVRTDKKISNFMVGHEKGQIRGKLGGKLSIPASDLTNKNYRKGTGGVKRRFQPKTLLKEFDGARGPRGPRVPTRRRKPFVIKAKNGISMIVKRTSKKRLPLEVLYIFKKKIKIDKSWEFEKTVKKIAKSKYKQVFNANLAAAIRNAR